jgi:hypothetical protein
MKLIAVEQRACRAPATIRSDVKLHTVKERPYRLRVESHVRVQRMPVAVAGSAIPKVF